MNIKHLDTLVMEPEYLTNLVKPHKNVFGSKKYIEIDGTCYINYVIWKDGYIVENLFNTIDEGWEIN